VILNGIDVGAVRGDLISRVIAVPLSPIPEDKRLPEKELWSQFNEAAPLVFGALLTALSQAVRDLPTVTLQGHPRMADFARLVVAAETALGFEAGEFRGPTGRT
jgi:putative DNA primase/helicase